MELFSDHPNDEGLPGKQRRRAMLAVMTATTMAVFDGTIINVALPQISQALQTSAAVSIWVSNAYLLATAMTLAAFAAPGSGAMVRRCSLRLTQFRSGHKGLPQ